METYTVITFAPVQGFIEKSRKLRDLYGSSYLLSLLSWAICQAAKKQDCSVVSPASINVVQGMPNQIIIKGEISEEGVKEIRQTFYLTWKTVADTCREWIEKNVNQWQYSWQREWNLWSNYAWEFFYAIGEPGESITQVRERINQVKTRRDWTGINWQGESSTLSGADAIAYPHLGATGDPRKYNYQQEQQDITGFYLQLSLKLGQVLLEKDEEFSTEESPNELEEIANISPAEKEELAKLYGSSFINVREELSIPELIKRLITHRVILSRFKRKLLEKRDMLGNWPINFNCIAEELNPKTFKDLNRHKDNNNAKQAVIFEVFLLAIKGIYRLMFLLLQDYQDNEVEEKYWAGWFQGDGDGAGKYFKSLKEDVEARLTKDFSQEMRSWGNDLIANQVTLLPKDGRMIYAGGDDFLGVIYERDKQIQPGECLQWFYTFKSQIWHQPKEKKITASVGFVWAGSQVPQRDILQQCHLAEQSAKKKGRDRIAFRILFNSGKYLEWVCPWWVLDKPNLAKISEKYTHLKPPCKNLIESYQDRNKGKNWTHFYQDVALLESRHAFDIEKKKVESKELKDEKIPAEISIAVGLIEIYFGQEWKDLIINYQNWWNLYDKDELQIFTGILGGPKSFDPDCCNELTPEMIERLSQHRDVQKAFNDWVINLAKVGFYLTEDKKL